MKKEIKSALFSIFHKEGLDKILPICKEKGIKIYATGGTAKYIASFGIEVNSVEELTNYPSILGGRVKTLHPKVFGGILAKRKPSHLNELGDFNIPAIDLVVVDLYPFEETLKITNDEAKIVEKIDIGGISLIRAAAKNHDDILVIPSRNQYQVLEEIILQPKVISDKTLRKKMAAKAFEISSYYDSLIFNYMNQESEESKELRIIRKDYSSLRYGENPHQEGRYYHGNSPAFTKLSGKDLSYNNLVDFDSALALIEEFDQNSHCFAILKHTNVCGIASSNSGLMSWQKALAGDPISAFGGVLIYNNIVNLELAKEIDKIFYELLIAKNFSEDALQFLKKKKRRILVKLTDFSSKNYHIKKILNGFIWQSQDRIQTPMADWKIVTDHNPSEKNREDLYFANICVKHLKSNAISIVKDKQLLGMGCGQTSRVDACKQAIDKAQKMGFDLSGACLASDAFFPFPDCVELASTVGISSIIQPGGSIKDQLSIDACNQKNISMAFTAKRHFKH